MNKNYLKLFTVMLIFCISFILPQETQAEVFNGIDFSTTLLEEDFEYTTSYTANDWTFVEGGSACVSNAPTNPYNFAPNFPNASLGFGWYNFSFDCPPNPVGTKFLTIQKQNEFTSLTSGRALFEFDMNVGLLEQEDSTVWQVTCGTTENVLFFTYNTLNMSFQNGRADGQDFSSGHCPKIPVTINQTHNFKIDVNYLTGSVNVYKDDIVQCSLIDLGTETGTTCHNGIYLTYADDNDANVSMMLDNVNVFSTQLDPSQENLSEIGQPCDDNGDCLSDFCNQYSTCSLKLNGAFCSIDSQCLSGDCNIKSKCTKPTLIQLIQQSKNEQFGDDTGTNTFVSLFIMVGVMIGVVIAGAIAGHVLAGLIAGMVLFMVLGILLTLIGWLPGFILFSIFLVLFIGTFFAMMFGRG